MFAPQENESNLRAVPMRNDDAKTSFDQIGDVARRLNYGCVLVGHAHVLVVFDERIAANGDDDGFHSPEPNAERISLDIKFAQSIVCSNRNTVARRGSLIRVHRL